MHILLLCFVKLKWYFGENAKEGFLITRVCKKEKKRQFNASQNKHKSHVVSLHIWNR